MSPDQFELMYFGLRTGSIIQGVDPANEARPYRTIDEDFKTEMKDFLGKED